MSGISILVFQQSQNATTRIRTNPFPFPISCPDCFSGPQLPVRGLETKSKNSGHLPCLGPTLRATVYFANSTGVPLFMDYALADVISMAFYVGLPF